MDYVIDRCRNIINTEFVVTEIIIIIKTETLIRYKKEIEILYFVYLKFQKYRSVGNIEI